MTCCNFLSSSQCLTYRLAFKTTKWKTVDLFHRCDQLSVQPQQDCVVSLQPQTFYSVYFYT